MGLRPGLKVERGVQAQQFFHQIFLIATVESSGRLLLLRKALENLPCVPPVLVSENLHPLVLPVKLEDELPNPYMQTCKRSKIQNPLLGMRK